MVTNIRIDKELKAQATELFNDLGLTLSQAFTVFLKQAILHHGLPFAVTRPPSKELLEAIKEGEELAHDPNAMTNPYKYTVRATSRFKKSVKRLTKR